MTYFRQRKAEAALREVTYFINNIANLHGVDDKKIIDTAVDCAGILAAQYFLLSNANGAGHIPNQLRDSYVLGYVAGSVADACEVRSMERHSVAYDLCWIMVTHRVFAETLREAAALLERCKWELSVSDLSYQRGYEHALRDFAEARTGDQLDEGSLAIHLRRKAKHLKQGISSVHN